MALRNQSETERKELDKCNDEVDPRVQIELEKLNTATDDINKLEVDLDEARAGFRQLLCDSTVRIDVLAKKLGACVERARPYYEARMRAKEALQETQQAAVRFERANSAHAAAKEMVFLAEEGLSTEGRTFDHAWQEMLNHATMRVNESERERTLSELEHRRTSQCYHRAEVHVQQLQKELKRAIAKSRPYFEMKAQFNHLLEEQKKRVKCLEQQVANAKMSYAEALHNLEQISDEIHRTRKYDNGEDPLGVCNTLPPIPKENDNKQPCRVTPPGLGSSPMPDDGSSDSQSTGLQDSDSGDEFMKLPPKLGPIASPIVCKVERNNLVSQVSEYLGLSELSRTTSDTETNKTMAELPVKSQNTLQLSTSSPKMVASSIGKCSDEKAVEPTKTGEVMEMDAKMPIKSLLSFSSTSAENNNPPGSESSQIPLLPQDDSTDQVWTEISLVESPDETSQPFAKMGPLLKNKVEGNYVRYSPLPNKTNSATIDTSSSEKPNASPLRSKPGGPKVKLDSSLSGWISGAADATSRRQSLDTLLWGGPTSERVKELLSHGMMMLNISSLTERRASEPKVSEDHDAMCASVVKEIKGTEITKKVPSPLEKSLNYLNAEDDSTSDSESLASVEMLTDEQISSLMLDQDIQDACEEVLGTPISEISPLIQDLKEKMQYNQSDFDDE